MRKLRIDVLLFVLAATLDGVAQGSAGNDHKCEVFESITRLESAKTREEAQDMSTTVERHLEDLASSLSLAISRAQSESGKAEICFLAGTLRARHVVSALIDNITLQVDGGNQGFSTEIERWYKYPCQEAVVHIGEPALSEVILRISLEDAGVKRDFLVRTLVEIMHDPERAIDKIEDTIGKFDTEGQRRLVSAEDAIRAAGRKM